MPKHSVLLTVPRKKAAFERTENSAVFVAVSGDYLDNGDACLKQVNIWQIISDLGDSALERTQNKPAKGQKTVRFNSTFLVHKERAAPDHRWTVPRGCQNVSQSRAGSETTFCTSELFRNFIFERCQRWSAGTHRTVGQHRPSANAIPN